MKTVLPNHTAKYRQILYPLKRNSGVHILLPVSEL